MLKKRTTHIIVDMLYDFIDGSLACSNAEAAVENAVKYINEHPDDKVLYVCDSHPAEHSSFKDNGGQWPAHCVAGTRGAAIHKAFYQIENPKNRPNEENTFRKGESFNVEQYSGYAGKNAENEYLFECATKEVVISGIATEFCVKNTAMEFLNDNFDVTVRKDNLGYVDAKGHEKALEEMKAAGIKI